MVTNRLPGGDTATTAAVASSIQYLDDEVESRL
jgi:hypothetical protein